MTMKTQLEDMQIKKEVIVMQITEHSLIFTQRINAPIIWMKYRHMMLYYLEHFKIKLNFAFLNRA